MRRSKPWLTALLQLVILITVVACAAPWLDAKDSTLPIPRRFDDIALRGRQPRPVFNGSVVPGGVYSLDELRAAVERDPVVAAHYHAMKVDEMRLVTLTEGKAAYVSYRVGDRVFWTRNRVYLKAGETVLTDGHTTIRARCGNCVSEVKQQAESGVEPAHGELDDFVVPPTAATGVDPFAAEAERTLGDLLEVPFGPQVFASAAPALIPTATQGVTDDAFGRGTVPVFFGPPGGSIGGGGGTGGRPPGGSPGGGGGLPPGPPVVFVPGDGGTGSPGDVNGSGGTGGPGGGGTGGPGADSSGGPDGSGTGGPGGSGTGAPDGNGGTSGSLTGSPTDTLTTGFPADTTASTSTGTPSGDLTSGTPTGDLTSTSGTSTNGVVNDDTATSTTASGNPSSTGVTSAPEPEVLWLVAAGLIGVARRGFRKS